jgi:hypothetical protein
MTCADASGAHVFARLISLLSIPLTLSLSDSDSERTLSNNDESPELYS